MAKTIDILAKDDNGDEAQTVANIPTKRELFEKNNVSKALLEDDDALENLDIATFARDSWDKPNDGFAADLENGTVDLKGMSKEEFLAAYKRVNQGVGGESIEGYKPDHFGKPLSSDEFNKIIAIGHEIYKKNRPDKNTVFQKVVCAEDIKSFVEGANSRALKPGGRLGVGGSTLLAKDGKHMKTPADYYDGLQLNYKPDSGGKNPYYPVPKCIYVVRYTTDNPEKAKIPVHEIDEIPKDIKDDFVGKKTNTYPFTGNGFTPASDENRLGTPEVMVSDPPQVIDKAVIVRIDEDGTETIVGYNTTVTNEAGEEFDQFVYVNEKGELIKPKI